MSAHDIAAELRRRLPGVGTKELHRLLYSCQGHRLSASGAPLFTETISPWDMGPVVGQLWRAEKDGERLTAGVELDEAHLNTIGYVVSRYGALSGYDLEILTHGEPPWREADIRREPGGSAEIEQRWMEEYCAGSARPGEEAQVPLDPVVVAAWLSGAADRRGAPAGVDDPAAIRARLAADA